MTIETGPPITIRTDDITMIITEQPSGKILIEIYQRKGKKKYITDDYLFDGHLTEEKFH